MKKQKINQAYELQYEVIGMLRVKYNWNNRNAFLTNGAN
jgi:hypothetical protein